MATDVPRTADFVIIGGGVHGASLAFHLARKKAGRVLLIEKKFIASGPTGRSTALVRRFYAMDFFTRTASAAADMFRHWKDVVGGDGDPGFQQVGMLALAGPDKAPYLRHNALQAQKVGSRVALISPSDVKALVPAVNVEDIALASYEAESGYADPSSTANALANRARELGATLVQYRHVDAIRTAGDQVVGVPVRGRRYRRARRRQLRGALGGSAPAAARRRGLDQARASSDVLLSPAVGLRRAPGGR